LHLLLVSLGLSRRPNFWASWEAFSCRQGLGLTRTEFNMAQLLEFHMMNIINRVKHLDGAYLKWGCCR
jgi:hypothetical protein